MVHFVYSSTMRKPPNDTLWSSAVGIMYFLLELRGEMTSSKTVYAKKLNRNVLCARNKDLQYEMKCQDNKGTFRPKVWGNY